MNQDANNLEQIASQLQHNQELANQTDEKVQEIKDKLNELQASQKGLIGEGDKYLARIKSLSDEINTLKNRINSKSWWYDNRLRVIAVSLIAFLLVVSLVVLLRNYPVWKDEGNNANKNLDNGIGLLHPSSFPKPFLAMVSTAIYNEDILHYGFHDNESSSGKSGDQEGKPSDRNRDTFGSESAKNAPDQPNSSQPTKDELPTEKMSALHTDAKPSTDSISVSSDDNANHRPLSGVEIREPEIKVELRWPSTERAAPNEKNPNTARTSMSVDEAKFWSFAILSFTLAVLFGLSVFTIQQIVRDE
jgi:hypothetical protein